MSFNPSKSGTYRIGVRQRGGQLEARLQQELMPHLNKHLTDELYERLIRSIAEIVSDVSEEQNIEPPRWVVVMDCRPNGVFVGFQDEDGETRSVGEMETEIHRRAVSQML